MRHLRVLSAAALLVLPTLIPADQPASDSVRKRYNVPYKFTIPKHIVVRAKINGKGPFNLVLDTGAPALILATKAARQAGVKAPDKSWATLDRFELEGGLKIPKTLARIETPFQLEGMNGMGLAGMEIHGLLGYQAVAKFRMEIDFTKHKMVWTELQYNPARPLGLGGKGGGQGGLEVFGSVMKTLGQFLGRRSDPEVVLRGFHGLTLVDGEEHPRVESVLAQGPAGSAGLQPGDVLKKFNGRTVTSVSDVLRFAKPLTSGRSVKLLIERNNLTKEITLITKEGI